MTFQSLALIEPILRALKTEGYESPTPIQAQAIPSILQGRDLLGCAQTGTGKTAAFAIPTLQLLQERQEQPLKGVRTIKTLILTPTRELAIQIDESFAAYGRFTNLKHAVVFGGVSQQKQTDILSKGVDILVATPGRLLDLMQQGYVRLQHLEIFVLDEADRMLDMGFIHDVRKVIAKLPAKRQTLFFSATMPPEIQKLADAILVEPVQVAVTPVSSTAELVRQGVYFVDKADKRGLLLHLLKHELKGSVLVFTRTKHGANKVTKDLVMSGIKAEAIHGNKSQTARQNALSGFKNGQLRVLVATDIAARGIDIDALAHVINYEVPNIPETYVHRIGRTGRAGASGEAWSFCEQEEQPFVRDIQKLIGTTIPVIELQPFTYQTPDLSPRHPQKQQAKQQPKQQQAQPRREEREHRPNRPLPLLPPARPEREHSNNRRPQQHAKPQQRQNDGPRHERSAQNQQVEPRNLESSRNDQQGRSNQRPPQRARDNNRFDRSDRFDRNATAQPITRRRPEEGADNERTTDKKKPLNQLWNDRKKPYPV